MQQNVRQLDTILFWPLSLHATGALFEARANEKRPPSDWLQAYADYVSENTPWHRCEDPLKEGFGVEGLYDEKSSFAEFVYFHPFVEKILYPGAKGRAMEVLYRRDVTGLQLKLAGDSEPIQLAVKRLQLFLFTSDLAVIAVHLSLPCIRTAFSFHHACDLLNTVRRTYPPFFVGGQPGQSPLWAAWKLHDGTLSVKGDYENWGELAQSVLETKTPPVVAHWAFLLKKLEPWTPVGLAQLSVEQRKKELTQLYYEQLGDERAHAMVYLALDDPSLLPENQQYRLAFLDQGGEGWEYNPDFLQPQAKDIFYDRFWHVKTRYMVTGYSFGLLTTSGAPPYLFQHFQQHYFMLTLLALMQKNSLLIFWDRLTNLLTHFSATSGREARETYHNEQRWLAQDFSYYLARFDFSEVSNQLQPLELFDMMRRNMRLDKVKAEVLQQMEYARDIENSNYEEGLTKLANRWIPVSLALAFLGLSIGMGSYGDWLKAADTGSTSWWEAIACRRREIAGVIASVAGTWVVFRILVKWPWAWVDRWRERP